MSYKMRSTFFASIAHELRTPLNAIIPMITKLKQQIKDEGCQKYIQIIKTSSLFLKNIIEEALDMSRIENNTFQMNEELFDIRQAAEDVIEIMKFQTEQKKLQLVLNIDPSVPDLVKTDSQRYKQILFNLVGNAIKFTFSGSIKITVSFISKFLVTQVQDTGIGIKEEDI